MAYNENDVTDGATDGEFAGRIIKDKQGRVKGRLQSSEEIRRVFDAPTNIQEGLADAIVEAQRRALEAERTQKQKALPDVVRASVRCGNETIKDHASGKVVIRPAKMTFGPQETGDGTTVTVEHGRPVRLKRAAFLHYQSLGQVVAG